MAVYTCVLSGMSVWKGIMSLKRRVSRTPPIVRSKVPGALKTTAHHYSPARCLSFRSSFFPSILPSAALFFFFYFCFVSSDTLRTLRALKHFGSTGYLFESAYCRVNCVLGYSQSRAINISSRIPSSKVTKSTRWQKGNTEGVKIKVKCNKRRKTEATPRTKWKYK